MVRSCHDVEWGDRERDKSEHHGGGVLGSCVVVQLNQVIYTPARTVGVQLVSMQDSAAGARLCKGRRQCGEGTA